ncbi:MAG: SCO family protein [Planctomycetota bacterium]
MYRRSRRQPGFWRTALAAVTCSALAASSATAQLDAEYPDEMKGVGIDSKLNDQVPLDLTFQNEDGKDVTLRELLDDKPTILTLNYYQCPMLCTLTLNGMVATMNELEWSAGEEFNIITVSFVATEGPDLSNVKKRAYLTQYTRESAQEGWHFLTGDQANIDALTKSVGFNYKFNPKNGEWIHTSSLIYLTPKGRVSLYMHGVKFEKRDMRLALVHASEGTIGTFADNFMLFTCFRFNADDGSFVPSAFKIMRTGGMLTLVIMAIAGVYLWKKSPKIVVAEEMNEMTGMTGFAPAADGGLNG